MYHSRLALRGSISSRAIRDRDLHHVPAFSDQLFIVRQFFGSGHRIFDSWIKRIRRSIAQSAHHRLLRTRTPRANDWSVLSVSRFGGEYGRNPWRVSVETRTSIEFSRSSGNRSRWNDFLCQNDSPKPTISPERFEKRVGDEANSQELATCRFCYSELQQSFVSSRSHWEHLERMVSDRLWRRAECWMYGTKRCFTSSYMHLHSSRLRSTGASTAARACCCLSEFCYLAGACIC